MWTVIALIIASAIAAYLLIGYPLLLAVAKRRRPPPAKDPEFRATVSVILAVYNGELFLRRKLDSILALHYPRQLLQILVVSDGSTDRTEAIVREYADRGVQLLVRPHQGKSAALNAAFSQATGELLFFTDVRQTLHPDGLSHLVANMADPSVGAVTGEMQLGGGDLGEQRDMSLYWRYELWARRRHSEIDSLFNTTGCIYLLRRSQAHELPPDTLTDDAVLPLGAFFNGYRVIFDPQAVAYDEPAIAGTEFRRRWRTLAGLWQVHVRTRALFTSANRMRWHFLSHKFGRLILPWAMLGVLGSTLALPDPVWRRDLLYSEAAFLALALLDILAPRGFPLKRLTSSARTFLLMNAAALAAIAVFVIPAQRLWKPTRVRS